MEHLKFIRKFFLFLTPFILIFIFYLIKDPFKTIYKYSQFYNDNSIQGVILNRDYVSFETLNNTKDRNSYNSFILGNSRSIFYKSAYWKKYLPNFSQVYHFDASGESLYGLERKLVYLDNNNYPIKNVLLVIDESVLSKVDDSEGFLLMKHYSLSGKSEFYFQLEFFKAFLNFKFFVSYLYFSTFNDVRPFMRNWLVLDDRPMNYSVIGNEISFNLIDSLINVSPEKYYNSERKKIFYERSFYPVTSDPVLNNLSLDLLKNISSIFKSNNTNFKVVISPLYDQKKINPSDLKELYLIFGNENVYDFSGKNIFTTSYTNFYETSHYRPTVANKIIDIIYSKTD